MEDFENVGQVLAALQAGTIDAEQAELYIEAIQEFGEEAKERKDWEDDCVRNSFINSILQSVPPGAQSDIVAIFAWDTAQRLMDLRARKVGITVPDRAPTPEEANAVGEMQAAVANQANAVRPVPETSIVRAAFAASMQTLKTDEHDDGPY